VRTDIRCSYLQRNLDPTASIGRSARLYYTAENPMLNFFGCRTQQNSVVWQWRHHFPSYFSYQLHILMGWFNGKSTGNHGFSHQIWCFPVNFPLNQSIDTFKTTQSHPTPYFCWLSHRQHRLVIQPQGALLQLLGDGIAGRAQLYATYGAQRQRYGAGIQLSLRNGCDMWRWMKFKEAWTDLTWFNDWKYYWLLTYCQFF